MSAGRFEILGTLATGGMAEILLARVRGEGGFLRPVVVKRILRNLARDDTFVRMFLDEARHLALVRHPNVVAVHDLGRDDDGPYLVLEYLDGEPASALARRLAARGERLPPALAAWIVAELCAGLHAAHEARDEGGAPLGLVHRDVAPQNVMVGYDGHVRVLDFGIAFAERRLAEGTAVGSVRGTFEYMSPEQCRGERLDRRSDVFSAGILLYELATGVRLFKRGGPARTMRAITEEPVVAPSRVVDSLGAALDAVTTKALAIDVAQRHQTAAELRADLLRVVHALGEANPIEAMGARMRGLFDDRIEEKRRMLAKVREGSVVERVPDAVAREDAAVELPELPASATRVDTLPPVAEPSVVTSPETRRAARLRMLGPLLGVGAVLGAVPVLAWVAFRPPEAPAGVDADTATPLESPEVAAAPEDGAAPDTETVELDVTTRPPGASVRLDGTLLGATPIVSRVAFSTTGVRLQIDKQGYEPYVEDLVLDRDARLVLTLRDRRTAPVRRKPPPRRDAGGFRRFD